MKENQIKNRELAVQAITQKNNLQAEVDKQERLAADLENKATRSLQAGNRELAKQFLKENPAMTSAIEDRVRRELGLVKEAKDLEVATV